MHAEDGAILFRPAHAQDISAMIDLILTHGPNQWNYLPDDEVRQHMQSVASGKTLAILAFDPQQKLVGLATFLLGILADFQLGKKFKLVHLEDLEATKLGYVAEAVVHSDYVGRGIGARLLEQAKLELKALGAKVVYAKRHEENLASAGMMRKAGFVEVAVFDDADIRTAGSRRTAVCRFGFV